MNDIKKIRFFKKIVMVELVAKIKINFVFYNLRVSILPFWIGRLVCNQLSKYEFS